MKKQLKKVSRQKIEEVTSLVKKLQTLTGKKVMFKEDISDYRTKTNDPEFDEDEEGWDEWDPALDNEEYDQIGDEYHNSHSEDFDDDLEIDQPNSPFQNSKFKDNDWDGRLG